jgi:hypothetical protein
MPQGLFDGWTFFRRAGGEGGLLKSAHVVNLDATLLLAVGNPSDLDIQTVLAKHPIADFLVAGGLAQHKNRLRQYSS